MTPEAIFQWASLLAMIGWLLLLIGPPLQFHPDKLVIGIIIAMLSALYSFMLVKGFQATDFMKFSTLEGVMSLLGNKTAMTAGWIHYLAFDLFTGTWIVRNARKLNIRHLFIVPSLLFTFMAGPFGLLLYLLIRWIIRGSYFSTNES